MSENVYRRIVENGIWMNNPWNCRIHKKAEHQSIPDERARKICSECDGCTND